MAEYAYTTVPGKIRELLAKIRQVGIPEKATQQWLKSLGYTSSNDRSLLSVLRQIRFLDESNRPTQYWREYRGPDYRQVLASAIREGYPELFQTFPDAHNLNITEIENVVRVSTTAGERAVELAARSFRELCSQADFSQPSVEMEASGTELGKAPPQPISHQSSNEMLPSLHIDIQVHISPEATSEQIEKIFESMARHLYGKGR